MKRNILGFKDIALIVVGLAIIILGILELPYVKYEMKGWKKTTAVVSDKVYITSGPGTFKQEYTYEYCVNGHKYSNVCKMPGNGPGATVEIYVNPDLPFKSVEAGDGLSVSIIMMIFGAAFVAMGIRLIIIKTESGRILSRGYRLPCVVDSVRLSRTSGGGRSNLGKVVKLAMDSVSPQEHFDGSMQSIVICIDPNTGRAYMSNPIPGTVEHITQGMNINVYIDKKNPKKYVVDVPESNK